MEWMHDGMEIKIWNFELEYEPYAGHLVQYDEKKLNQISHENSQPTTRTLADKIKFSYIAVES